MAEFGMKPWRFQQFDPGYTAGPAQDAKCKKYRIAHFCPGCAYFDVRE
jgi:hypothetical protein